MNEITDKIRGKKPSLLTFEEAKHALGWSDERMATIKPVTGFRSKAAEQRWPIDMKQGSLYLPHIEDHITRWNPARLPYLAEAVEMAQRRLGLMDAGAQAMVQPSNVTQGEFVGLTDRQAALQSA